MKSSLYVTALESGSSRVMVPEALLGAFSLRPHDQLYAVMVPRQARSNGEAPTPCATLYASPFSHRGWDRLVAASFTTGHGPGTVAHLSDCLQRLHLYPRLIETAETRPLTDDADAENRFRVIGPDTTTVLEVPRLEFLESLQPHTGDLHKQLHNLLGPDGDTSADTCVQILRQRLRATANASLRLDVDSLMPLRTLNRLGRQLTHEGSRKLYREVLLESVKESRNKMCIPCDAWRGILWPESRNVVEEASNPQGTPMAVIVSVDTDEHVITLQFYRLGKVLIASFDIVVPASGLEQRWWRWVYEEVSAAGGNVLGSRSSGRLQGKWGTLSVVAAFPGRRLPDGNDNDPNEDIRHAVRCFRMLKGSGLPEAEASAAFKTLLTDIRGCNGNPGVLRETAAKHCLGAEEGGAQLNRPPRMDSTLQNVRLWYKHAGPSTIAYEKRFGRNPFNFTKPLRLESYSDVYGDDVSKLFESRLRLAERLCGLLVGEPPENVVLVGAYRSGKTTIMNLVVDMLNGAISGQPSYGNLLDIDNIPVLAVRINAAVTPPELLFVAVFNEICKLIKSRDAGVLPKAVAKRVKTIARRMSATVISFLAFEPALEINTLMPLVKNLELSLKEPADKDAIEELVKSERRRMRAEPTAERAGRLRASVVMLRALLQQVSTGLRDDLDSMTTEVLDADEKRALMHAAGPLRIVVALDEVTDSATWGSEWAFPAWRQLIEDPASQARWLFSSTKPLSTATTYSPLGNAMREYNLEPLHEAESSLLIKAMEQPNSIGRVQSSQAIRPTVTYYAEKLIGQLAGHQPYLLQVLCCHLFEECIREDVPIITTRLVAKIVRRRVLLELGDYFASQWETLSTEHGEAIKMAIREKGGDLSMERWAHTPPNESVTYQFKPEVQKALERAGVGSGRLPTVLVPLFAKWAEEHFGLRRDAGDGTVRART